MYTVPSTDTPINTEIELNKKIYKHEVIKNIEGLMNDIKNMFPDISPSQLANLLNSGANIGELLNKRNPGDTIINSRGIHTSNTRGPSTNILQKNFKGTSNVYSPYLYYNKATTERFMSTKK